MAQSKNGDVQVLIVAAEASSALYALRLLEYWEKTGRSIKAFGVGSREMEANGFEIIGRSEEMAVVGLTEVIKHYSQIKSVFENLVSLARARQPRLILLLDYPDFNLRLAKKLKPLKIPIVYYISPQVWAWRKSRIHNIKKVVDKMLCVLPFEKDFYQSYGVDVDFVGHPLIDEINPELFSPEQRNILRQHYGFNLHDKVIGLMPGSRHSEIQHHLLTQIRTAEAVYEKNPAVKFALLIAPTFEVDEIKSCLPPYSFPLAFIKDEPLKMVSIVDIVLCASGTATLVVGLLKKPMVIMYKMNPFSAWLARLIVKGTAHFGLVNLILGKRVVPELFQSEANPERLARELRRFVDDSGYFNQTQNELSRVTEILGQGGATEKVARIIEPMLF